MGINFNALPQESGSGMKPGPYKCKVVDVKMRTPKPKEGVQGKDYMQLTYELSDINGNKKGKMFDSFFDSDSQALQYKLGRLNYAAGLNLVNEIELKDLAKLMPGKEYGVITKEQVDYRTKEKNGFLEADLFGSEIFFRLEEFAELVPPADDSDLPFTAPDAEDAAPTTGGNY